MVEKDRALEIKQKEVEKVRVKNDEIEKKFKLLHQEKKDIAKLLDEKKRELKSQKSVNLSHKKLDEQTSQLQSQGFKSAESAAAQKEMVNGSEFLQEPSYLLQDLQSKRSEASRDRRTKNPLPTAVPSFKVDILNSDPFGVAADEQQSDGDDLPDKPSETLPDTSTNPQGATFERISLLPSEPESPSQVGPSRIMAEAGRQHSSSTNKASNIKASNLRLTGDLANISQLARENESFFNKDRGDIKRIEMSKVAERGSRFEEKKKERSMSRKKPGVAGPSSAVPEPNGPLLGTTDPKPQTTTATAANGALTASSATGTTAAASATGTANGTHANNGSVSALAVLHSKQGFSFGTGGKPTNTQVNYSEEHGPQQQQREDLLKRFFTKA